jgi:large subunit ribosomal protein L25
MTKDKHTLTVEPRKITGRKVKILRREGLAPANIFGSKIKSAGIQVDAKQFLKLYDQVGDTGLIDLQVKGEKQARPTLVHLLQTHPVTGQLLHVDFRQVDLTQKITAHVPVELVGESPAVEQKGGILVHSLDEVEVEALPADFPDKFEIDISSLLEIGDSLHVSDLKVDAAKVVIQTPPDTVVASVEAPKEEEEEQPEVKPEDVEATEEKGKAEPDSGEAKPEKKAKDKEATSPDSKPAEPSE